MKIVVLAGGTSTERDVSIVSGTEVCKALRSKGHQAILMDVFFGKEGIDPSGAFSQEYDIEKEVEYIKSHRNLPLYVLYDDFAEKIGYQAFQNIYHDKTYTNIRPTVDEYPHNLEFSGQFATNHKLDYDEVVELRKQYAQHIPWKQVYEQYQDRYPDPLTFWNIYNGNVYKLVMPEVFTLENKKAHTSIRACKGQNNGRAKLTWDIVRQMRKEFSQGVKTRKQIQEEHPEITPTSINNILRGATWKE